MATILVNVRDNDRLDGLTARQAREQLVFVAQVRIWNETANRQPEHLRRLVAEEVFCASIPADDDSVSVAGDDRAFGCFHTLCAPFPGGRIGARPFAAQARRKHLTREGNGACPHLPEQAAGLSVVSRRQPVWLRGVPPGPTCAAGRPSVPRARRS